MRANAFAAAFCLVASLAGAQPWHEHAQDESVTTIGFAACYAADRDAPITAPLVDAEHDLFVFLGDNVYADTTDHDTLRAKWKQLTDREWFQSLTRTSHVLATWDDHDFGANDAGKTYPERIYSQRAFLDAFNEPEDTPRRRTPGVYDAKTFGPEGKRVQVILLDTRYFRDDLTPRETADRRYIDGDSGGYLPARDAGTTILGREQWAWLDEQLREPAELRVVVSSIQALTTDHGWESWALFPHERDRLMRALADAGNVVIVSGDRHKSEITRSRAEEVPGAPGRPICELTVGSINKPIRWYNEINSRRVGSIYFGPTYGRIEIDWDGDEPSVRLLTMREDGSTAFECPVEF